MAFLALFVFTPATIDGASVFLRIHATAPGYDGLVSVRAIIQRSDGSFVPGEWGASDWPAVDIHGKALTPESIVEVPVGVTTITIGKGPEFLPQTIITNLDRAGEVYTLPFHLQPCLDLYGKGWRAGDAHIHYFHGDGQISRMPEEAYAICAAGGLNFASFAEEQFGAPNLSREETFRVWRPYELPECELWIGVEAPKSAWGHHASILYDPWKVRDAIPYNWGIHSVHEQGGVSFPVHPERMFPGRSFDDVYNLYPLNNHLKFLPVTALTGHLLDAWSGVSDEAAAELTLASYFKLLEMGYKIPLLADSDFCMDRVNNGLKAVGFWMNYLQLEGDPLSKAAVCTAIRKGRAMCTTGPLVLFNIDAAQPGDTLPADGTERHLRIEASYQFNPWTLSSSNFDGTAPCSIASIDLIRNGEVYRSWSPGTPTAVIEETLPIESTNSYYMVRVLGNEGVWMAGYASPIYFETAPKPRQPDVFKSVIDGQLFDAKSGLALTGTVSCVRYGRTEWTIPTDEEGRFRARVPIDAELVATDTAGRELTRNLLNFEPAYSFCHYLPERYTNKAPAIDDFTTLVRGMTWDFPIGYQSAGSYVRTPLKEDADFQRFSIRSTPPPLPGKTNTEIALLLIDKTQVQPGDRINYAVIFRQPQGRVPVEELVVAWGAWDPARPKLYSKYGTLLSNDQSPETLIDIGDSCFVRRGSLVVPEGLANPTGTTGALRFYAVVRQGELIEEASLIVPLGPTRRELLVSATWDGFPASWSDLGVGPCNFYREHTYQVRYPDFRDLRLRVTLSGQEIRISPKEDTKHVARAEQAVFLDRFYYDGQCEPENRNIAFRQNIVSELSTNAVPDLPIVDPMADAPPRVALMEPLPDQELRGANVRFYYFIDHIGISGPEQVSLIVDGTTAVADTTNNPIHLELSPGAHVWQIVASDSNGTPAPSEERTLHMTDATIASAEHPQLSAMGVMNEQFLFGFTSEPARNYLIEKASVLTDWHAIIRTNAWTNSVLFVDPTSTPAAAYRVRAYP